MLLAGKDNEDGSRAVAIGVPVGLFFGLIAIIVGIIVLIVYQFKKTGKGKKTQEHSVDKKDQEKKQSTKQMDENQYIEPST